MKNYPKVLLVLVFLTFCGSLKGQDTLITRIGEKRLVRITEIGVDEIRYTVWNLDQSPVIAVSRNEVRQIVFANGEVMTITPDAMDVEHIQSNQAYKRNAIKTEFFAPLTQNITVCYERVIRPGLNIETKLGIIGVGLNHEAPNASGFFLKIGPKYWSGKDFYVRGMRMSHPLRGVYIKPELIVSLFRQTQTEVSVLYGFPNRNVKVDYTHIAANICFGKQVLLGSSITLDYYIGLGYGWQTSNYKANPRDLGLNEDLQWESYAYSHLYFGRSFPMILSGGMTLGYMF